MSYSETSSTMEDEDSSIDSNTDATICNTADLCSSRGLSMISDNNMAASSSTSIGDDLIVSGASSRSFMHNNQQSDQEIRIFNVDFGKLSAGVAVHNSIEVENEAEKGPDTNDLLQMNISDETSPNVDMRMQPRSDIIELRKGSWTPEEDMKLLTYIQKYGCWSWWNLPKYAGLLRDGNSCILRWVKYLRPNLKRGRFSDDEDKIIMELHAKFGNRWSMIAPRLPGKSDSEIKNHWHTHIKKKLKKRPVPGSMNAITEEERDSPVSNTDAIIYGAANSLSCN